MQKLPSWLWISPLVWCLAARPEGEAGKESGGAAPPAAQDKVTLKSGQSWTGELIDITEKQVVLALPAERKTFPRAEVGHLERAASPSLLSLFQRKADAFKTGGTIDDWKGLALFCSREKLQPERRRALREIVRLDPSNAEARAELGHALLGDAWLDGEAVEAKRKEGYDLVGGKLVKPDGTTSVQATSAPGTRYHILSRTKLSASARKKMEKDREDRLRSADKFLEQKAQEYNGVDWAKRHKIRKRNFEIECNSTRKVAEAYGALMELIRAKLAEMFQSPIQRTQRATVFIYSSQEEFMAQDRMGRSMGRGLGGYYNPQTQSITAFHGTFGFTGTTFGVLCHEGTHYYQGLVLKDFDNIPVWMIEGLAVYFGDGSLFDPKTAKITVGQIPRDRLAHIQEKMLIGRQTPVSKLVNMSKFARGRNDEPFTASQYADAWALIYYLVNSGDKGKNLLMSYWQIGLEQPLKKEHFTELAKKYFGSVENLEKQYIDYILKLEMPSAGKIVGDYFVSDSFQFDFKAPGDEWVFFEDKEDKKLLVGLAMAGSSAEIRVYYTNNDAWAPADKYFEAYSRVLGAKARELSSEKVKSGKLEWYRLTYSDDGPTEISVGAELGGLRRAAPGAEPAKAKEKKSTPRDVTRFLLVQIDGVVEIECSAKKGEARDLQELFSKMHESFTLSFTRRW